MTPTVVSLVSTFNRPAALARSLPQIAALGWPCLVIDDGGDDRSEEWFRNWYINQSPFPDVQYLQLPANRGLAAVLNIGLAFWLADERVTHVNYVQDDIDLHPQFKQRVLDQIAADSAGHYPLLTGHDAREHIAVAAGPGTLLKTNCRATNMVATADYWRGILPIPTRKLGAPCREPGKPRGTGSDVDFWITQRAPHSIVKRGGYVLCLPGMVRTFYSRKEESCWDNEARGGADAEFVL